MQLRNPCASNRDYPLSEAVRPTTCHDFEPSNDGQNSREDYFWIRLRDALLFFCLCGSQLSEHKLCEAFI